MACRFEVTLPIRQTTGVRAANIALDEVDRLEQQMSIFRESSEVSFINRNAASRPIRVGQSLFDLLVLCRRLHRETEGAFDVTSGPLSRCWGFLARQGRIPDPDELESARVVVGSEKLLLDDDARTVQFATGGMQINLGSIGKGYALDRAASLIEGEVRSALASAGGSSIRAIGSGDRGHDGWLVGIRHPLDACRRLATLRMSDCAMSTSGSEEQCFGRDGKRYGHVIDPSSGMPADKVAGVTVVAPSAAVSDALATAFYVGGADLAERYCRDHPEMMVLMLEGGAERPVIFGRNANCEVQIV